MPKPDSMDTWGTWCQHGAQIVERDPSATDAGGNPVGRVVEPWPCAHCTLADFEAEMAAEEETYWSSLRSEIYP